MLQIERALPEQTGIPSACIIRFMKRLEDRQIPMHSLLIMHKDKLICESYYAPCRPDSLHRMFSITKSLTSVAIGLLADEGALFLDDPIIKYFPEKVPADVHPYIAEMTIRNMLMMRTCHEKTTYKLDMKKDWVESFFTTPPSHPAGTLFHYDTSSTHTLCALAEKLCGTDMLTYIKQKLSPLGLSEDSYLLKDPFGVSLGGSGLVATSMDLLKFGIFLYRCGEIDGRQYLSSSYLREATSCLSATGVTAPIPGESYGYGMQFWRTRCNGYMCYGMGGQLIIILPDQELICVTTADTQGIGGGNQQIYDALYEEILPFLDTAGKNTAEPSGIFPCDNYREFLTSRKLPAPCGSRDSRLSDAISGRVYKILGDTPFQSMQLSFLKPEASAEDESEPSGSLRFLFKGSPCVIHFGMGHNQSGSLPLYGFRYAAGGAWLPDDTFYIRIHILDEAVGSIHFQFSFQGNRMTLFMRKQEESLFTEFTGHLTGQSEDTSSF